MFGQPPENDVIKPQTDQQRRARRDANRADRATGDLFATASRLSMYLTLCKDEWQEVETCAMEGGMICDFLQEEAEECYKEKFVDMVHLQFAEAMMQMGMTLPGCKYARRQYEECQALATGACQKQELAVIQCGANEYLKVRARDRYHLAELRQVGIRPRGAARDPRVHLGPAPPPEPSILGMRLPEHVGRSPRQKGPKKERVPRAYKRSPCAE